MHRSLLPVTAIVLSAVIWGISTPIAKDVIYQIPPLTLAFLRFLLASLIFYFLAREKNYHTNIYRKDLPRLIVAGVFSIPLNIGFGFVGLKYATALDSVTFTALVPMMVALGSALFLKESMTKTNFLGQSLAFVGILSVIQSPTGPSLNRGVGDALLLFSSVFWVAGMILSKKLFSKYHSFTLTSFYFIVGTILFAPAAVIEYLQNPAWISGVTPAGWLGVVFLAVFTSVVAWLFFEWGLERSTATFAGISTYFQLLVGAVAAAILLGEIISQGFVVGIGLILLGVILATRPAHHYRKAHVT